MKDREISSSIGQWFHSSLSQWYYRLSLLVHLTSLKGRETSWICLRLRSISQKYSRVEMPPWLRTTKYKEKSLDNVIIEIHNSPNQFSSSKRFRRILVGQASRAHHHFLKFSGQLHLVSRSILWLTYSFLPSSSSLTLLWGLINSMQLVMCLPLVDVSLPPNAQAIFTLIHGIVNFQFFDTSYLDRVIFQFNRDDINPYSEIFDMQDIFWNGNLKEPHPIFVFKP